MTPAARVQAAIEILDVILAGTPSEKALTGWARNSRFAGSKDRAAVRDHVFGALRCKRSFGWIGGGDTGRRLMLGAIRDALIDPVTLFNGVGHAPAPLSDAEATGMQPLDASPDAVRLDAPDWLWDDLATSLGDDTEAVLSILRQCAPVHLRVNTGMTDRDTVLRILRDAGYEADSHALSPTCIEVHGAPRGLVSLPAFADGLFEMQDGASQAVVDRMAPYVKEASVLDYCAGGGGKSLGMAAYKPKQLVAHDVDARRMSHLPERAERAGVGIDVVDEISGHFDLVLCDAPCSGSGAWRRQPGAKWDLTPERLATLRQMQFDILMTAQNLVARGGHLAYATCSILDNENDKTVDRFLAEASGWKSIDRLRLTPLQGGDGFYLNVLKAT